MSLGSSYVPRKNTYRGRFLREQRFELCFPSDLSFHFVRSKPLIRNVNLVPTNITFEHVKDSLKKAKFLEIDCDEIPVPFAVLQGY